LRSSQKKLATTELGYVERINRVMDHIVSDLSRPVRLNDLAELADLSPFHFHRVFQAMVGETPSDFVKRLRLERALYLMSFGKPESLTKVAMESGFSSSSDFTRSFKQHYGVAPSKFDLDAWKTVHGERIEAAASLSPMKWKSRGPQPNPDQFRVRIRELPTRSVAYIRVANPYFGDSVIRAARRLLAWANEREIADGQWLGYQFESPRITALEHCHYCVAVEVKSDFQPRGEIGLYRFPPMLVAEVPMKGGIDMEIRLFQWLYGSWLPRSQYVPADQPCFEAWSGTPFEHGNEYFELSIQLPIK
jgi:AraC family transcriptional regulator